MTKVSAIIVSYNVKKLLRQCLDSLRRPTLDNGFELEVWVVDNNSKDGTSDMVAKEFSWVNFISNERNLGFAVANNQAIGRTKSKYVFLLNPDAEVLNESLSKMVGFMEDNTDVGILGPQLVNTDGSVQKENSLFPKLLDSILVLLKLHRLKPFNHFVYPNYDYNEIQDSEHLMGSALFVRSKIFEEIGLFDEKFFLWFEETDLEKRVKESGWRVVYYPRAKIKHFIGSSSRHINPLKKQTIWNKSLWYYFQKHHSVFDRVVLIPFMIISYIPAILVYFSKEYLAR